MLDSFEAHKTEQVKRSFKNENTDLAAIPGGLTSVLQPLDVSSAIQRQSEAKVDGMDG